MKFACLYKDGTVERRDVNMPFPERFVVHKPGREINPYTLEDVQIVVTMHAFLKVIDGVPIRAFVYAESGVDQKRLRDVALDELQRAVSEMF